MKFINTYDGENLIYVKQEEDRLNKNVLINIIDILIELQNILESSLDKNTEIVFKHNNDSLLKDEYYTDGKKIYSKEELDNIPKLVNILKEKTLYPLIENDVIMNEPITKNKVNYLVKNGIITDNYNLTVIAENIIKDYVKSIFIDYNSDKQYILDTFNLKYQNKEIYLEEPSLVDSVDVHNYILDKIESSCNIKNTTYLIEGLIEIGFKLEEKIVNIVDKHDIKRFSLEPNTNGNLLLLDLYLPYSSLRAKVTSYILTKG